MLVNENGPADIFEKLRAYMGVMRDADAPDMPYASPESIVGNLLLCVWCTSVWVALLFTLLWAINPALSVLCALPFALSAVACFADWKINK